MNEHETKSKSGRFFGVVIEKGKYSNKYGRNIEVSISTNHYHWIGLPNLNMEDLKEMRKAIRKYIREENK